MHFLFAKYYLCHLLFVSLYFLAQETIEGKERVDVLGFQLEERTFYLMLAVAL